MKRYVINLDWAVERLTSAKEQFQKNGLDFIRVSAIDGHNLPSKIKEIMQEPRRLKKEALAFLGVDSTSYEGILQNIGYPILNAGDVACFFSHRECLRLIAEGSDPYGAVFEDDLYLSENAHLFLKDYSWIKSDVDMIKLDAAIALPKVLLSESIEDLGHGYQLRDFLCSQTGGAGYIISRSLAKKLYDFMDYPVVYVDDFYYSCEIGVKEKIKVYQLFPAIIQHGYKHGSLLKYFRDQTRISRRPKTYWGLAKRELRYVMRRERILERLKYFGRYAYYGKIPFK